MTETLLREEMILAFFDCIATAAFSRR